jgi:hypothetical protein
MTWTTAFAAVDISAGNNVTVQDLDGVRRTGNAAGQCNGGSSTETDPATIPR